MCQSTHGSKMHSPNSSPQFASNVPHSYTALEILLFILKKKNCISAENYISAVYCCSKNVVFPKQGRISALANLLAWISKGSSAICRQAYCMYCA